MRPRPLLLAVTFPALLGALVLLPSGCGSPEKAKPTSAEKKAQEDPWLRVATSLRQESDAASCRRVLNELNQALASAPVGSQRRLGEAEAAAARSELNLGEAEMKEIRSVGYTPLDPNHLAEALYLREVARSLDLAKAPVAERARAAFDWVCRQVILQPWVTPVGPDRVQLHPPLPPTFVLRRGSGSGLERMFVFAALCKQLELDAYLIGPAAAAGQPVLHRRPGLGEFPRGPFWGLGVRDGADILLFDPWKEQALPGKNGRPATLADVRADPRSLAVWLDNKDFAWDVTADDLKAGEVYLVAPLSAVAPRNKALEEKLASDLGAKLSVNLAEARKSAEAAAKGVPVRFYSPAQEPFAPTRALDAFLPRDEGGSGEPGESPGSLYAAFFRDQIPAGGRLFPVPAELTSADAKNRLVQMAAGTFGGAFLSPPTPREKLQRGQFVEVTQHLVRLRDHFAAGDAQKRAQDPVATRDWIERVNALSTEFNLAKREDQPALRARIEALWAPNTPTPAGLIAGAVALPGLAEATFLLALAKHEQAERAWTKARRLATAGADPGQKGAEAKALEAARAASADAWLDARDWWSRYAPMAAGQSPIYPGRGELAKRLTERANLLAAAK